MNKASKMLTNLLLCKEICLKTWILKNLVWTAPARVDQGLDHPVSHQKLKKTQYANEHSPRTHVFRKKPPKVEPKGTPFSPRNAFFLLYFSTWAPKVLQGAPNEGPKVPKDFKKEANWSPKAHKGLKKEIHWSPKCSESACRATQRHLKVSHWDSKAAMTM